jgi:hypothetical protein
LANRLFFELSCVFGFLHLHFSHSDFDNNICLLNWGNATRSFLQILNGFFIGFTLGGSDCYRVAGRAYINRMRLSTDQIQAIYQAATTAFGQGTSVWLFGSRVDDAKRGGDIDLLVCP